MPVQGSRVSVSEGKEFEVLPKDVYQCELLDIKLETQKKYQSEETEDVLNFIFVVVDEGAHYGRQLRQYATQKLTKYNGGSNLYKVLVGLNQGKDLSDEDMKNIPGDDELNALIGKQVRLSVGQKEKTDKTMRNVIEAYLPIKAELPRYAEKPDLRDEAPAIDFTV